MKSKNKTPQIKAPRPSRKYLEELVGDIQRKVDELSVDMIEVTQRLTSLEAKQVEPEVVVPE